MCMGGCKGAKANVSRPNSSAYTPKIRSGKSGKPVFGTPKVKQNFSSSKKRSW